MAKKVKSESVSTNKHRPVIIKTATGWKRPKKSKLFPNPVTIAGKKKSKKKSHKKKLSGEKKKIHSVKAYSHEPLIIKEGSSMYGKKKTVHHKGKKLHGEMGAAHKKSHHRRHHGRFMGVGKPGGIADMLMSGLVVGAGALGGSVAGKMTPVNDAKIKAGVPIAVGIALPFISKNQMVQKLALGSIAIGLYSLVKSFAPSSVPLLGTENITFLTPAQARTMGLPFAGSSLPRPMGLPFSGRGFKTPADVR